MIRYATLAALLPLAACMPKPAAEPTTSTPDMCAADDAQAFVGQPYSDALAADIRAKTRSATGRAVRPGQMVTMEFNARRVTITLDANDRITRIACG